MAKKVKLVVTLAADQGKVSPQNATAIMNKSGNIQAEVVEDKPAAGKPAAGKAAAPKQQALPQYRWIWAMFNTLKFTKANYNDVLFGAKVFAYFPKIVEGGGLGWLEPVEEGAEPTNTAGKGYFVAAKGKPALLSAVWREYSPNNDGAKINGSQKKFRESVQLHIYTEALYGQDLEITLMDNDLADPDDNLAPFPRTNGQAEIEKGKQTPKVIKKYFQREVKIYPILTDEKTRSSKVQVTDYITQEKQAAAAKAKKPVPAVLHAFVQKVIVDVFIDDLWKYDAGNNLEIYPVVKVVGNKLTKTFSDDYIKIEEDEAIKDSPLMAGGNKPVLVGDIPTNAKKFQPCKYEMIIVNDSDGDHKIFDENILSFDPSPNLTYNIVAGAGDAKQTIKLSLKNLVTNDDECRNKPLKHREHVMDITGFQKSGYKPEDEKAGIKKPEEKKSAANGKLEIDINKYKIKRETKGTFSGVVKSSDSELEFDAMYKYQIYNDSGSFDMDRLWGYLWLPDAVADKIPVALHTCRWEHNINFAIYPDIEWTVGAAFNMDKEDFDALKKKFEDDNKGKGMGTAIQRFAYNRLSAIDKKMEGIVDKKNEAHKDEERDKVLEQYAKDVGKREELRKKEFKKKDKPAKSKTKGKIGEFLELLKEFDFTMKVEWNNGADSLEPVYEFIARFYRAFNMINDMAGQAYYILNGAYTQKAGVSGDGNDPEEFLKKNEKHPGKSIQGLMDRMKRKPYDYELKFPKVGIAASWYYETMPPEDESSEIWGAGRTILIVLEAKPLVGIDYTMDFLEMLCRRHPLAYAILKVVDGLLYLLADNPDALTLSLVISGQIDLAVTYKYNTVGGSIYSRKSGSSAKKEEVVKGGAYIRVKLKAELKLSKTTKVLKVEVVTAMGMGLEGGSGLGIEAVLGSDEDGLYVALNLLFEGIKIEGYIEGKLAVSEKKRVKEGDDEESSSSLLDFNPKASFEIGIDKKSVEIPKIYLSKKDEA